jgi:1,4-alpha-glucan branching enzyme
VHRRFPGVLTCAEESTSWPKVTTSVEKGGLGFDLKWTMGWMNDTLAYFRCDPIVRGREHEKLSFSLTYAFTESFLLPLSHDEVVHGKASLLAKMPGDHELHFANLRALFGFMFTHPGKKLLFMGGEFGQWSEWSHERSLEWDLLQYDEHRRLQDLVRALNRLYRRKPALHEVDGDWKGFEWLDVEDRDRSVLSFLRRAIDSEDWLVVAANFTPVTWKRYRLGVPDAETYRVAFNTDAAKFGGTGAKLPTYVDPKPTPHAGRSHSLVLDLPPLAVVVLEPTKRPRRRAKRQLA